MVHGYNVATGAAAVWSHAPPGWAHIFTLTHAFPAAASARFAKARAARMTIETLRREARLAGSALCSGDNLR
eukprot:3568173-Lingulodinium_polyedra.AAC.1